MTELDMITIEENLLAALGSCATLVEMREYLDGVERRMGVDGEVRFDPGGGEDFPSLTYAIQREETEQDRVNAQESYERMRESVRKWEERHMELWHDVLESYGDAATRLTPGGD